MFNWFKDKKRINEEKLDNEIESKYEFDNDVDELNIDDINKNNYKGGNLP